MGVLWHTLKDGAQTSSNVMSIKISNEILDARTRYSEFIFTNIYQFQFLLIRLVTKNHRTWLYLCRNQVCSHLKKKVSTRKNGIDEDETTRLRTTRRQATRIKVFSSELIFETDNIWSETLKATWNIAQFRRDTTIALISTTSKIEKNVNAKIWFDM